MPAKNLKIHFIGIGGIGVSALARYYLTQGHEVSGSDLVSSEITESLKKMGAKVFIGKENPEDSAKKFDLLIHSPAVNVKHSMSNILSYPEALGELTKQHFTIAVSGTHGKSTTTAMLGLLLIKAGLDPTVIVGTKLREFGDSNFRFGKKVTKIQNTKYKILVIEADEHMASFLNYWPKIIVLTTIEEDHLDYYKNLKNILKTFREYLRHLPQNGILVANKDDKNIQTIIDRGSASVNSVKYYSLKQKEAEKLKIVLKIPGEHNVSNALAALAVARILKIPDKVSFKALSEYRGSWRRFEITKILYPKPYTLISDYGHHPTEIRVTLKAAREKYPKNKIWCVFQPHQYQRTFYLWKDFIKVFKEAPVDKLIITDIYDVAGRETPAIRKKVSAEKLVKKISKRNTIHLSKNEILNYLEGNLRGGEVVVIMGAGDIYELTKQIKERK